MTTNLNEIIYEKFFVNGILKFFPDKQFNMFEYFIYRKRLPNLKNPKTFSEKVIWIKLYGNLERFTKHADKYEVREFVKKTIGEEYLIPMLGIYSSYDEIDFDKLPKKFILKATNASGYNFVCKDKSKINKKELKEQMDQWMKRSFYFDHREPQYKNMTPRVICEELLDEKNEVLMDYKFFCYNGVPKFVEVFTDAYKDPREDLFDLNWKNLKVKLHFPNAEKEIEKPKQLLEMVELAKKLSKIVPFVRVDLYVFKNKIYFGELTFTPGNGMYIDNPPEADIMVGKPIDLPKYK